MINATTLRISVIIYRVIRRWPLSNNDASNKSHELKNITLNHDTFNKRHLI